MQSLPSAKSSSITLWLNTQASKLVNRW
uniref:Uncharacterized protein n=1 Tax=Anguilla anguilla TaxID=7936 RepID=A0A0E9PYT4_ANGAN